MPTFIDESGNTGSPKKGGTLYFRLGAVWVPTIADAERFRRRIQQLRQELGEPQRLEFKFSKTHHKPQWREAFFAAALAQEFRFAIALIDKRDPDWASSGHHEQLWACATEIAVALRPIYHRAEQGREAPLKELIVVDNNKDRDFLDVVKQQFRGLSSQRRPGSSMIGKVLFRDSAADKMIQLVDMICGAVGAMIDDNDRVWYDQIASRDLNSIGN